MKQIQLLGLLLLCQINYALNIHQIRISERSPSTINIGLDTEAPELYYFHSWNPQILGNTITIKVFYAAGFGSTIAYLNNNFEISIDPNKRRVYQLNVKVYYKNLRSFQSPENLQDQWSGFFSTPLSTPLFLINPNENSPLNINYINPNNGLITIGSQKASLDILDENGAIVENKQVSGNIDFSHLQDGLYYFRFKYENTYKTIRIILKK